VTEVGQPTAGSLDLLGAEVRALRGSVRSAGPVVVQDLAAPVGERATHRPDLRHLVALAGVDGVVKQRRRTGQLVDEIDHPHRFLRQPGAEQLVLGIADTQSSEQLLPAALVEALFAFQEQLADPKQRIVLAPSVPEGLVLDPPADLVEHPVGDANHMERVGHRLGVGEVRGEPRTVGVGQVESDDLHPPAPANRTLGTPSSQLEGASSLEEVEHPAPVEVDQDGRVDGGVGGVGRQIGVLVDPEGAHRAHPAAVVDKRGPVEADRRPGGVPGHAVLDGDRGHRAAALADLAGHLGTGAHREHLAGGDAFDLLGPGLLDAAAAPTAPATLSDHQPARPSEAVQVPQLHLDAVLGLGPPAARRTRRLRSSGLGPDDDFARTFFHREHLQPGKAEHLLRQPDTVVHRQGPPSFGVLQHRNDGEVPDLVGGWVQLTRPPDPHSFRKSHFWGGGGAAGCRDLKWKP